MRKQITPLSSGFTLVELVMVIVLIGALSVLGVGLFTSRSAFSPLLATQQLTSATLLAQQSALAGNPANTVTVDQVGDRLRFVVGASTATPRVFELPREGTALLVAGGLPRTITFNPDGIPDITGSLAFRFSGTSDFETCLSTLGAVYRGSCQ